MNVVREKCMEVIGDRPPKPDQGKASESEPALGGTSLKESPLSSLDFPDQSAGWPRFPVLRVSRCVSTRVDSLTREQTQSHNSRNGTTAGRPGLDQRENPDLG